jgi:hypothetical protein
VLKTATGGPWGIVGKLFVGLKVMGLPRANKLIRSTLKCGPCVSTVKNNVRQITVQYKANLLPGDVDGRMRRAARLWAPILIGKIEDGVLAEGERVPVTSGADATPTPAHPQYCGPRNIVAGICGPICADHKCTTTEPVQIANGEAGFNQIVELIRTNVWSSYVYVHILQPQVRV